MSKEFTLFVERSHPAANKSAMMQTKCWIKIGVFPWLLTEVINVEILRFIFESETRAP